jgi:hypothetical protein
MINNSDMTPGRFLRWHSYRKMVLNISNTLRANGEIVIATYTRSTRYSLNHVGMFKATKSGAYVQRGKNWDCFSSCKVLHYRLKAA